MTDELMIVILGIIGCCLFVAFLMRHGDYEHQRILSPGIYQVGVEIPPGRCDLVAESGDGDFSIKNKKANDWVMGNTIGVTSGLMAGRFRNVTLNPGDILEINGNVRVMLAPPVPVDILRETIGPGIYRFGVDIYPPAKYDFKVVSGSGEIVLVDIRDNNFNLYQEMAEGNPHRPKTFDNVVCSRRYDLWVNGSLQLKLTPSKHQFLLTRFRKTN